MLKIASLIVPLFILSACSTPPAPVAFPDNAPVENADTFINRHFTNQVEKNTQDKGAWDHFIITHGNRLNQAEWGRFWYLAHHADNIRIEGNQRNISTLKSKLLANGATHNISIFETCKKCENISIYFSKKARGQHDEI